MKYQCLTSIGAALLGAAVTVSASPLAARDETSQCPAGYTLSVYTVTMYPTPSTTSTQEPTSTPSAPAVVVHSQAPAEVESSTPAGDAAASTSSAPAPTFETPVPETTQAAVVVTTSSTENSEVQTPAPITSSSAAESMSSQTSTSTAQPASTTTSSSLFTGTSGEATYYTGSVAGGTCSFSGYTLPSSLFGTALSAGAWDDAAKCGACVAITGPSGNTIKAMIVDQCPSCPPNHFDLFQNAYTSLSALATGVIDISWSYTPCDLNGPLKLRNKDGTSAYWFSMQVVNANEPVTALEVSTDGGSTWQSTTRTYYNYFERESGFGTDTVDVRVTGESGNAVVVGDVGCMSDEEVTAASNL